VGAPIKPLKAAGDDASLGAGVVTVRLHLLKGCLHRCGVLAGGAQLGLDPSEPLA
jgi:hypothetical protein